RRTRDDDPWKKQASRSEAQPAYDHLTGSDTGADAVGSYIVDKPRVVGGSGSGSGSESAERAEPDLPAASAQMEKGWENFSAVRDDEQLRLDMPAGAQRGQRPPAAPPGQEKIIVLHVVATEGEDFAGPAVHTALQLCRLQFGMRDVYHRITEANGVPEAVYSIASMVKPGFLDPGMARGFSTPGLTLFMVMPGPIEGVLAFRDMLETAQQLAQRLGGEILDDKRTLLTHQTEQYLHDQIAETERRWRAQPRRK
ncbi:MAG: cell division protein ZipA, partial [Nevskiales bacterium]